MHIQAATIGVSPGQGYLTGTVQNAVVAAVAKMKLPTGYSLSYAGSGQQGASAVGDVVKAMEVAVLLMYSALFALWFFLTLYLQQVLGFTAIEAGLSFLPMTLSVALGSTSRTHLRRWWTSATSSVRSWSSSVSCRRRRIRCSVVSARGASSRASALNRNDGR